MSRWLENKPSDVPLNFKILPMVQSLEERVEKVGYLSTWRRSDGRVVTLAIPFGERRFKCWKSIMFLTHKPTYWIYHHFVPNALRPRYCSCRRIEDPASCLLKGDYYVSFCLLAGKPELRGYNLSPLSSDEIRAINNLLKSWLWICGLLNISVDQKDNKIIFWRDGGGGGSPPTERCGDASLSSEWSAHTKFIFWNVTQLCYTCVIHMLYTKTHFGHGVALVIPSFLSSAMMEPGKPSREAIADAVCSRSGADFGGLSAVNYGDCMSMGRSCLIQASDW